MQGMDFWACHMQVRVRGQLSGVVLPFYVGPGIGIRSSNLAASALTHWAILPALIHETWSLSKTNHSDLKGKKQKKKRNIVQLLVDNGVTYFL